MGSRSQDNEIFKLKMQDAVRKVTKRDNSCDVKKVTAQTPEGLQVAEPWGRQCSHTQHHQHGQHHSCAHTTAVSLQGRTQNCGDPVISYSSVKAT